MGDSKVSAENIGAIFGAVIRPASAICKTNIVSTTIRLDLMKIETRNKTKEAIGIKR